MNSSIFTDASDADMRQTSNTKDSKQSTGALSRRDFLFGLGPSMGAIAFSSLLASEEARSADSFPLAPKQPMVPAKAKACIFLMMEGEPSHIDTFDPKPKLRDLHMKKCVRTGKKFSAMSSGNRYYVQSPFSSRKVGRSGADMCDPFKHLADVADELCFYRGCQAESVNHPAAMYHMNTGNRLGGDPAIGSWVTYGLGTLNQNLPAFIVLPELAFRMQMEVPDIIDIDREGDKTKALYGIGAEGTDAFGRRCLLARRLVEQGVRFVQVYSGGWDSHDFLERAHGALIHSQP